MAIANAVPGFTASINGLRFSNGWPDEPAMVVKMPAPIGDIPIGNASNGLCGGMVYTVIDVFTSGLPPIADTTNPPPDSPLYKYIVARLFDSFDLPAGVLKYYEWMTTPDHDSDLLLATRRGVAWLTITQEWPRIRADIDGGSLSPLGLVTVHTSDPMQLGHCHQVLAHAYEVDDTNRLTLHLYDPNTDLPQADGVQLSLDLSAPTKTTAITHNVGIDRPIRGFFRTNYRRSDPSRVVSTSGVSAQ